MHFLMRSVALVCFPGGFGTLDELFEVMTLTQTGKVRKRPIVLVGREFWTRLVNFDWLVETGMISRGRSAAVPPRRQRRRGLAGPGAGLRARRARAPKRASSPMTSDRCLMKKDISLIGAPTDIGAGARGASMGPEALRVAGIVPILEGHGLAVIDRGNLVGPANPWLPPVDGYRHLAEVVAWNQRGARGGVCRTAGWAGCRSCSAATTAWASAASARWRGIAARPARSCACSGSTRTPTSTPASLTPSGNVHGMPVACLCGFGPQPLIEIGGTVPAISPKWVRQIGIRSVDAGEKRFVHEQGLEVFDMRYIDEMGMRHAMELALATLDANTHLHVSFDVDFLDPDIAPGVGTTVPGGPTYREAQLCMEMIADTGKLASLDVMELNPALDVRNKTAELAVDLIESLFGKSTLMRARP